MKTPLPKKVPPNIFDGSVIEQGTTINQLIDYLIDYLTELTKVVEGKASERVYTEAEVQALVAQYRGICIKPDYPTLKEQLLGEIATKTKELMPTGEKFVYMKDVEAIIERIIK